MSQRITIRIEDCLAIQLGRIATKSGITKSEVARVFIQDAVGEKAGDSSQAESSNSVGIAGEMSSLRDAVYSIKDAIYSIEETLLNLTIAVQKLYQQPTAEMPAADLTKRRIEPPGFAAWAADKPWREGEEKAHRVHRLARDYRDEFGVWPANYSPPS